MDVVRSKLISNTAACSICGIIAVSQRQWQAHNNPQTRQCWLRSFSTRVIRTANPWCLSSCNCRMIELERKEFFWVRLNFRPFLV